MFEKKCRECLENYFHRNTSQFSRLFLVISSTTLIARLSIFSNVRRSTFESSVSHRRGELLLEYPSTHQRWDLQVSARVPCQKYRLAGKAGHETSVFGPAVRSVILSVRHKKRHNDDDSVSFKRFAQHYMKREE